MLIHKTIIITWWQAIHYVDGLVDIYIIQIKYKIKTIFLDSLSVIFSVCTPTNKMIRVMAHMLVSFSPF